MQTRSTYYPSPPPPTTRTRALGTNTVSTANASRTIQTSSTTARRRHLTVTFAEPIKPAPVRAAKKIAQTDIPVAVNTSTVRKVVKSVVRVGKKLDTQNKIVKKPRTAKRSKRSGKNTISS